MMALAASRGWNYQATNASTGPLTISLYVDPQPASGMTVLAATAQAGLVPTVLTSTTNANTGLVGGLGLTQGADGYHAAAEVSAGSNALVPGAPLLVSSTLTQGTTTTPYAGVTATVVAVGAMPNASACPNPTTGASVRYTYGANVYTIAFVPGCGMTQVTAPSGAVFNLISVSSYPAIGQLARARRVLATTYLDTAKSLLGLEHTDFPAAALLSGMK